jgi:hypothetical protein
MRPPALLLVLLALALALAAGAQGRVAAPADAAGDVRLVAQSIETVHPAPFRSVSRQRFRSRAADLASRAPGLSRDELLVGILRLIALLGPRNGHTGIFPLDPANTSELHLYPLRLYSFADGVFVVDEAGDLGVVGARLVAIAGIPLPRILELVRPLVPHDNASSLRGLAPHFALVAEVLDGLGIADASRPVDFTFERPGGMQATVALSAVTAGAYRAAFPDALHGHYPAILPAAPRPLYLASSAKAFWTRTLAHGHALVVGYNVVAPPPESVLRTIARFVASPRFRRVVVDVRLNGGGDNTTYSPLLGLLASKRVNRPSRLYLLIGRATFSAAANFTADLDRDTRATMVGEPTGGGVETYGDVDSLLLPSTGWSLNVATRYHDRRRGPRDRRLAVAPDIRVDLTSADYFAGRDPVLERALRGL